MLQKDKITSLPASNLKEGINLASEASLDSLGMARIALDEQRTQLPWKSKAADDPIVRSEIPAHDEIEYLTDWEKVTDLINQESQVETKPAADILRPDYRSPEELTDWDEVMRLIKQTTPPLSELIDKIKIPSPSDLANLPIEVLQDLYQKNREQIGQAVDQLSDVIPRLGMSGLGEKALEILIETRNGTYGYGEGTGGQIISWGIVDKLAQGKELLLDTLEGMADRAIGYAYPIFKREYDQNPGGIVIILPDKMYPVQRGASDSTIGEDRRELNPGNFDNLVVGIIGKERFADFVKARREISQEVADAITNLNPSEYNRLLPRSIIGEKLCSQLIIKDVLNLLSYKHEVSKE